MLFGLMRGGGPSTALTLRGCTYDRLREMSSATVRQSQASTARPSSSLELPVTALPGIGDDSAKLLDRIEIRTIGDLLWHLPRTYADFSKFTPLKGVRAEQEQTVAAILPRLSPRHTARGQLMTEVELVDPQDHSPTNLRATWFGRRFIKKRDREGRVVRLSGKGKFFGR